MKIVCRCEDITYEEILEAIRSGYTDIESLKRKLNFGMGPCRGRICIPIIVKILARELGKNVEEVGYPSERPPIIPLPLGILATGENREEKS
ncbi:MAG: (2Fe-2S)-binding protein [Thermoprotei archaeon]|nr:MAG: (2Fe-2S)-binding protein [Thermoprotei archaeon]